MSYPRGPHARPHWPPLLGTDGRGRNLAPGVYLGFTALPARVSHYRSPNPKASPRLAGRQEGSVLGGAGQSREPGRGPEGWA